MADRDGNKPLMGAINIHEISRDERKALIAGRVYSGTVRVGDLLGFDEAAGCWQLRGIRAYGHALEDASEGLTAEFELHALSDTADELREGVTLWTK